MFRLFQKTRPDSERRSVMPGARREPQLPAMVLAIPARGPTTPQTVTAPAEPVRRRR